jgi:superfamily II DNA or RNA helicase
MDFSTCSKRYISRTDDNLKQPKLLKNIANFGLKPFECAKVGRHGEYHGIEIQAIDEISPLFMTDRINKMYSMLESNNITTLIEYTGLGNEYIKYGNDIFHYIIKTWCEKVHVQLPSPNIINNTNINDNELLERVTRNVSHEIVGKFRLVNVGTGEKTKEPVLPLDWIGKEFNGASDLHTQMNSLPSRIGKPPVTYCCTYGMLIQTKQDKNVNLNSVDNFFVIAKTDFGLKSNIYNKYDNDSNSNELIHILKNKNNFLQVNFPSHEKFNAILFVEKNLITENNEHLQNSYSTSYMCSLMQKCFRNANMTNLLNDTIDKLHYSKGYNLPDQHFAKVSGPKQLCWRSYISIIEDVDSYTSENGLDLLDLLLLSLVFTEFPNLCLTKNVLVQLKSTMTKVQNIKTSPNWRHCTQEEFNSDTKISFLNNNISRIKNSIILASFCIPMMVGDRKMLGKFYNYVELGTNNIVDIKLKLKQDESQFEDNHTQLETRLRAYDMHCHPALLIELQGCLPYVPATETLQMLSSFIWEYSSSYNIRYSGKSYSSNNFKYILKSLTDIQHYEVTNNKKLGYIVQTPIKYNIQWIAKNPVFTVQVKNQSDIPLSVKRNAFLLIFGRTYRLDKKVSGKVHNIVICGDTQNICKVKLSSGKSDTIYVEGKDRFIAEKEFVNQFQKDGDFVDLKTLSPPTGWKWKTDLLGKQKLSLKILNSNDKIFTNQIDFFVGSHKLSPFDGSILLEQIDSYDSIVQLPELFEELLNIAFYNEYGDFYDTLIQLHEISKERFKKRDFRIFEWTNLIHVDTKVILYVRARILMSQYNVLIGPCDRKGDKTSNSNSISYISEGVIWRFLIALSALYPNVLKPNTLFNYTLDKSVYGYIHLMNILNNIILKTNNNIPKNNISIKQSDPSLKTLLWDHQKNSVNKIVNGFYVNKSRGFGDASGVGSGKTLVALSVMIELYGISNLSSVPNTGFLVMLPTEMLYDTWKDEIKKHTLNFNVVEQYSNGELSGKILSNTIVITTMGRCRDHPIIHQWLLTVIDECLTVQNKEALQTEEAWRQQSYSYFGVLMLSATFFRSRFDKMTYMLNMLNDTLPKTNDYLDTILSESIVCNLNENERKWITNINYYNLTTLQKNKYLSILANTTQLGYDKIYKELYSFIHSEVDYIHLYKMSIQSIIQLRPNSKILIYTSSKTEADMIATQIDNIHRFTLDDKNSNKQHIVVSYSEGTFGLNNLTDYDTILTLPPEPDKLPQMKGRLDRPNQQSNTLYLEYIVLKDTIEEASIYRLEICKNFYGNYIMPLADFFKIAVKNN